MHKNLEEFRSRKTDIIKSNAFSLILQPSYVDMRYKLPQLKTLAWI